MSNDQQPTIGETIENFAEILKRFQKKDAQNILKMVGTLYNLRIVSAFAPLGQVQGPPASRDTRGQKKPRVQPRADPEIKEIRSKIKSLNKQISEKSSSSGSILPQGDELIVQRNRLFRDLSEAQNKRSAAFKEGPAEG
jgi:hypothetical protein